MTTVILSPKFQVVVPKKIRDELELTSGMKLEVIAYKNRIEFIPIQSIESLRGTLKGINTAIIREQDRL